MMKSIEEYTTSLVPDKCKGCECADVGLDLYLNWVFKCELEECYMGEDSYNPAYWLSQMTTDEEPGTRDNIIRSQRRKINKRNRIIKNKQVHIKYLLKLNGALFKENRELKKQLSLLEVKDDK